jgi:hypothetical protein
MLNDLMEGEWTQEGHGEWTQGAPETPWKTLEESAAILRVIFPNYPRLDPCKPYDGKGQLTAAPQTVVNFRPALGNL